MERRDCHRRQGDDGHCSHFLLKLGVSWAFPDEYGQMSGPNFHVQTFVHFCSGTKHDVINDKSSLRTCIIDEFNFGTR